MGYQLRQLLPASCPRTGPEKKTGAMFADSSGEGSRARRAAPKGGGEEYRVCIVSSYELEICHAEGLTTQEGRGGETKSE